jgi:hypothetical protein
MSNVALHIKADGSVMAVQPKSGRFFSLEEIQGYVGGYFQPVAVRDAPGLNLLCNADGRVQQLPVNNRVSGALYDGLIVGDVLVVKLITVPGGYEYGGFGTCDVGRNGPLYGCYMEEVIYAAVPGEPACTCASPTCPTCYPEVGEIFSDVCQIAQQHFWEAVAKNFPAVKHGDFPPEAAKAFTDACEKAVAIWLQANLDGASIEWRELFANVLHGEPKDLRDSGEDLKHHQCREDDREAQYDGHGCFLCFTCSVCHTAKMSQYRADIHEWYECDEPIDEEG